MDIQKSILVRGIEINIEFGLEFKDKRKARDLYQRFKNGEKLTTEELFELQDNDML